jgi:hypothetical protein
MTAIDPGLNTVAKARERADIRDFVSTLQRHGGVMMINDPVKGLVIVPITRRSRYRLKLTERR